MKQQFLVAATAVLLASCSNLDEVDGGVVALEVTAPEPPLIEVNESLQLSARALDKGGESVPAPIVWSVADTTLSIDPASGILTGVAPGPGRAFASVGSLNSAVLSFTVLAPADSVGIVGDSIVPVPADQPASTPLQALVSSFSPPGPLDGRPVIFTIVSPDPLATVPTVLLPNGLAEDTVATGTDGLASVTLGKLPGFVPPLTVVVQIRASRTRGAVVPGSGQHFTVSFE